MAAQSIRQIDTIALRVLRMVGTPSTLSIPPKNAKIDRKAKNSHYSLFYSFIFFLEKTDRREKEL